MKNLIYTFFLLFSYQTFAIEKNEKREVFFKALVDKAIVKPGETLNFKLRLFSPKEGDIVKIVSMKPKSKNKRWRVIEIVRESIKIG